MKQILITGSTASQCSVEAHRRNVKFSSLLNRAFTLSGHNSFIDIPSVDMTFEEVAKYDSVIVGLSPFTSMSSHRIYGALHVLGLALEVGNAKILLDAPDPHLVFKSFRSVISNPSILTKNNYSSRSQYGSVIFDSIIRNRIIETIEIVANNPIPTIVPSLPYFDVTRSEYGLPESNDDSDLINLNLDSVRNLIFDSKNSESKYWSSDDAKSIWSKGVERTLSKPVLPLKRTAYDTEYEYVDRIKNSYGLLVPTYKNNLPWWSANIILSMSHGTPVFSDWRLTSMMGEFWSSLPVDAELLTVEEKIEYARAQIIDYLEITPDWAESIDKSAGKLFTNFV